MQRQERGPTKRAPLPSPPFTPCSVIDRIRNEHGAKDAELELMICDLTDFDAIKSACDDLKAKGWPIHVLLNNAGIQAPYGHLGQKTPGGFEVSERSDSLSKVSGVLPCSLLLLCSVFSNAS